MNIGILVTLIVYKAIAVLPLKHYIFWTLVDIYIHKSPVLAVDGTFIVFLKANMSEVVLVYIEGITRQTKRPVLVHCQYNVF